MFCVHVDEEARVRACGLSLSVAARGPSYLQARLAQGEALPAMEVKVGTKKRAKKEEQLRAAVAHVVKEMDPNVFEDLLDLLCDRTVHYCHRPQDDEPQQLQQHW